MAPLRIGLLGAARITPKAIIDPARVIPQTQVTTIAARDPERAASFAAKHGIQDVLRSYDDLIAADDIDLIYNALPINHHASWTIKALRAGKHVLCEKPFAMNTDEANAMLAASEASGKRLIEAFHYRYHPAFETCLDWVRSGKIGEIKNIDAFFNVAIKDNGHEIRHQIATGGGAMMDLGCYPLHWILTLMGDTPTEVEARAELTPNGVDETMNAALTFKKGAKTYLSSSMGPEVLTKADLVVLGSEGEITFRNAIAPHGGASLTCSDGSVARISPVSTYTYQLEALFDGLQSGTALPTEGEMIVRQQKVLDQVYEAAGLRNLRYLT
ncbi:MAG: Gfo/Idh/MocA family oxidoreductase [Pseudomonadota bacterium]